MAELPAVQTGIVTSRAPEANISPGQVAQPYAELAQAFDKVGMGLSDVSERIANEQGLQAVSRNNQTGELQVAQAPYVGAAADAYHRAVKFSALAQGEAEAKRQDLLLSKQFHNDPDGYLKASEQFRQGIVGQYTKVAGPEVGIALQRSIDNATTYNYRWLLLEQQRIIKRDFDVGTQSTINDRINDISTLIESGALKTPEGQQRVQGMINDVYHLYNERVNSPLGVEAPDAAKAKLKQFDQAVGVAKYSAGINDDIQSKGVDATRQRIEADFNKAKPGDVQAVLNYNGGMKAVNDYMANLQKQIHLNDTIQKQKDNLTEDAIIRDSASGNPQITETDIKNNPDMSPAAKMRMINWKKRDDMPEPLARTSELATQDIMRRMMLPQDDPNAITNLGQIRDAYANKGILRRADEEWLEKRFKEGMTDHGQKINQLVDKAVKASGLDKSTLMKMDDTGKLNAYRYEYYVQQRVDQYRKEGKNVEDLFDPNKSESVLNPETVRWFQTPLQDAAKNIRDRISGQRPPPPPGMVLPSEAPALPAKRQPGETPAQFLQRTGQ